MPHDWILTWEEAATAGPLVCGGKGWNLGRLHRYGFPVPVGSVLVAEAYERFVASAEIRTFINALTEGDEQHLLAQIRHAMSVSALPPEVETAVNELLRATPAAGWAVRSSATSEDSTAASFAGIHESVLHVRSPAEALHAIRVCYASLWTPQAVTYRRRLGLSESETRCAVALCEMVSGGTGGPPPAAGVAFSCDPRSGRRDQIVINAAPGWADKLVLGHVQPAEAVLTLHRGHVRHAIPASRAMPLGNDQLLELGRLVHRVHWALGKGQDPQDIEWVYDGKRFWLVQSRPVTRLPVVRFPDQPRGPTYWSNANLKEVAPGVVTPMTWSLVQSALREILYASPQAVGYPVPAGIDPIRRIAGRLYFDLTSLQWVFYDCFGLLPSEANSGIGGHQPEIAVPAGSPFVGRRGWSRLLANIRLLRQMLLGVNTIQDGIRRLHELANELLQAPVDSLSGPALLDMAKRAEESWDFGRDFQLANAAASGWLAVLRRLLTWARPDDGNSIALGLLSGSGDVTSAEHGYELWQLATIARQDKEAMTYLSSAPLDPFGWGALKPSSPFRKALENYLARYGHRAINELEFAKPRWIEDPTYLLQQIRAFAEYAPGSPTEAAGRARGNAERDLRQVSFLCRPPARWLARRARQGAALREAAKSALVAVWQPLRLIALEVGRRLTQAGHLDRAEDIFWLAWPDVEGYLLGDWTGTGARQLVADRKAADDVWRKETVPDVVTWDADDKPMANAPLPAGRSAEQLAGLGVSAGVAGGLACLLQDPLDGRRLRQGDVLVAPSTDPAWTPLFLRASAVVTEVGGYLSHGAIVAREYGIPAVVNVRGVMDTLRDGDMLTVDGDHGRVIVAHPSGESILSN